MYPSETRNVCLSYLSEEGPPVPGLRPSSFAAAASLSQTIIVPGNVLNLSNKFSSLVKVGPTSRVYCLFGNYVPRSYHEGAACINLVSNHVNRF